MSTLICVGPDDLDATWPLVRDLLELAYSKTDDVTPDLLPWLKRGDGLLWIAATDSKVLVATTTSIVQRASGPVCRIWGLGGSDLSQWIEHIGGIEAYAKAIGCVKVCFDGRRGWERMLPEYKPATIAFEKVL